MTTYVGMGLKRMEDPKLITGRGIYVDDLKFQDMLHAAFLRSPHGHARIKSIDTAAARSMPGVVAVVTADDLADIEGAVMTFQPEGMETSPPPHPILARGKVRYVGEPMAAVVAEDRYLARDALELIRVDYEPLPAVVDSHDALKDEVILHENLGTNVVIRINLRHGDLDEAFSKADRVVRASFKSQRVSPVPMETRGLVATYDGETDLLTVWSATNTPHLQKDGLAYVLKRDPRTIRVIAPEVGGSFGGKGSMTYDAAVMCCLASRLRRPIKWIEDRTEYITSYHAREMDCDVEAAVTSDGTILALRFRILGDIGAYFVGPTPVAILNMVQRIAGPYKTPVMHVELRGVATNKPTTGPYRGTGGPEAAYFMERTVDVVSTELGLDPTDVRRKNILPSEALPYTTPTGYTYDSGDYPRLLERVLALARYDDLRREQAHARAEGRLLGIGVSVFTKPGGGGGPYLRSTARVEIEPEGDVKVYTEASPHGQGTETTFAQIAADVLGILPGDVAVLHGDTDMLEFGVGSIASRAVLLAGPAVYLALQEARNKLSKIAADLFKCTPEEVEFLGGRVWPKGVPGREASFADITARAFLEETLPQGLAPGLEFSGDFTLPDLSFPSGAQLALVEVDQGYWGGQDSALCGDPRLRPNHKPQAGGGADSRWYSARNRPGHE